MSVCSLITPGVYLGNYAAACDKPLLDSLGITHILTVAADLPPMFSDSLTYMQVSALDTDSEDLFPAFAQCNSFIVSAASTGKVLVHCLMGISRSSTIIIAFLIQSSNLSFESAFSLAKSAHSDTDPNSNFIRQLKKLDSLLVTLYIAWHSFTFPMQELQIRIIY